MSPPPNPPKRVFGNLLDLSSILSRPRTENQAKIRALCKVAYVGDYTALCRVLGRYKMYVDTQDVSISSHLMLEGTWEIWVTEAICQRVRPGMVVADIGANLGYFSILLSDLVGPTGFVHAFEPNPRMVDLLDKSLQVNGFDGRAKIHQIALGSTDGERMVYIVPANHPGGACLIPFSGEIPEDGTLIETRRLDSDAEWSKIEFAKIDAEGAEDLIWTGAQGLLEKPTLRTVVLEFSTLRYSDPAGFLETVKASGFALNYIDPWTGVMPISPEALLARDDDFTMLLLER